MKDRDYLIWLHDRLTNVHKENPHMDYMHKLRAVIKTTPADKETPNMDSGNNIKDLLVSLKLFGHPDQK